MLCFVSITGLFLPMLNSESGMKSFDETTRPRVRTWAFSETFQGDTTLGEVSFSDFLASAVELAF